MPLTQKVSFTKNQKKRINQTIKKSKDEKKWYYDDLEDELFDTFHNRNLDEEKSIARYATNKLCCPNIQNPALPCTCPDYDRANNHGYVDKTNWDSDWGPFSGGSD